MCRCGLVFRSRLTPSQAGWATVGPLLLANLTMTIRNLEDSLQLNLIGAWVALLTSPLSGDTCTSSFNIL